MSFGKNIVILSVTTGKIQLFSLLEKIKLFHSDSFFVLVSNGCSPELNREITAQMPVNSHLITLEENCGGSGGFAAGMEYFLKHCPDHQRLYLCDDDAVINSETLKNLSAAADAFEEKGIPWGACVSAIETAETPGFLTECGSYVRRFSGRFGSKYAGARIEELPAEPFETEYCAATSLLISRNALQKTGTFDRNIFIHFDDVDWSFRCRKAGFPLFAVPDSVIRHPSRISKAATIVRYYDAANVIWFFKKHLPLFLSGVLSGQLSRVIYFSLHGFKDTAKLYSKGISDGLKSNTRLRPHQLKTEEYIDFTMTANPGRLFIFCSAANLEMGKALLPDAHTLLLPKNKIQRLLKNIWVWLTARKNFNEIVIDDDFKSVFILPFPGYKTIYWNIYSKQIRK